MQHYRDFQPTGFDPKGLGADRLDIGDWFVAPVSQTRDSEVLTRANFIATLRELGGESDTVQVHRFGHWGPGWFELILIDPADTARVQIAEEIENALADYPVVDESLWSDMEYSEACEYWSHMSLRERVEMIQEARERTQSHMSIFAARRDELPEDPAGWLYEALTRD